MVNFVELIGPNLIKKKKQKTLDYDFKMVTIIIVKMI